MRNLLFSVLTFVLLTGFTVKTDNQGQELHYPLGKPITVCWEGDSTRRTDVKAALNVWTSSSSSLEFVLSDEGGTEACQVTIRMVEPSELEYPYYLGETTPTVAQETGLFASHVIRINRGKTWSAPGHRPCSGEYDFVTVLAHELGHALGLGHSSDPAALMRPHRHGGSVQRELARDDQAGRDHLYPIIENEDVVGCSAAGKNGDLGLALIISLLFLAKVIQKR